MTQADTIAAVLHNILAFGLLWALVFCFWRTYRVERIRDRLFQLRFELFELAESRKISFNDPAYYLLRTQINRMLARAHRITGMRLLVCAPDKLEDPRESWKEAVVSQPREVRMVLESLESRMARYISWQVILGSPLSFAVAVYHVASLSLSRHSSCTKDTHQFFVDAVSRDAYEVPLEKQEATLAAVG